MIDNFPAAVISFLQGLLLEKRDPAYLVLDREGKLLEAGGKLDLYGLQHVKKGESLTDQMHFLQGMLPFEAGAFSLPFVEMTADTYADIHLFQSGDFHYVLLVDVTSAGMQQSLLQQKANDLNLLRNQRSGLERLLSEIDLLFLEKTGDMTFHVIGKVPEWIELCGLRLALDGELRLVSELEFLHNFATQAEEFWKEEGRARYKSGPWVISDSKGKEWQFEATAFRNGRRKIILIEPLIQEWDARFDLLQKARESNLNHRKLVQKEKKLREKELRNRLLLKAVPDWIFLINAEGKILDLKASMGKNPALFVEFIGQTLSDIFPHEAAEKIINCVGIVRSSKQLQSCAFELGPTKRSIRYEARVIVAGPDEFAVIVRDLPD
jgi:PAS domain-containing protein